MLTIYVEAEQDETQKYLAYLLYYTSDDFKRL